MRDLVEVIDQLLVHIPTDQEDLIKDLEYQKDSALYTAPEAMRFRWGKVAEILYEHMGEPPFEGFWKQAVLDIWVDK